MLVLMLNRDTEIVIEYPGGCCAINRSHDGEDWTPVFRATERIEVMPDGSIELHGSNDERICAMKKMTTGPSWRKIGFVAPDDVKIYRRQFRSREFSS